MKLGEGIINLLTNICVDVIKKLHQDDVILQIFKKEIPIIIHPPYDDDIIRINEKANPKEIIKDFNMWMLNN